MSGAPVRPVDAAGLILLRGRRDVPEILLGRRHPEAAFLPHVYVVPGGRVDPEDHRPSGFPERLHPKVAGALLASSTGRPPAAFLRGALRELYEETGLLLGKTDAKSAGAVTPVWRAYTAAGIAPDFAGFDFLLRAITPAGSPRRYNTRFFLGDGGHAVGTLRGDGELLDVRWWSAKELDRLNIVDVTWTLIHLALARWRDRVPVGAEPAKLLNYHNNRLILRTLTASPRRNRRPAQA